MKIINFFFSNLHYSFLFFSTCSHNFQFLIIVFNFSNNAPPISQNVHYFRQLFINKNTLRTLILAIKAIIFLFLWWFHNSQIVFFFFYDDSHKKKVLNIKLIFFFFYNSPFNALNFTILIIFLSSLSHHCIAPNITTINSFFYHCIVSWRRNWHTR